MEMKDSLNVLHERESEPYWSGKWLTFIPVLRIVFIKCLDSIILIFLTVHI